MSIKKIIIGIFLPLFFSSFLFSQSLAELAKKEKARRERIKGKKTKIVTNEDLKNLKKKPAISIQEIESKDKEKEKNVELPEDRYREEAPLIEPHVAEERDRIRDEQERQDSQLNEKWDKAKEYVGLLNLKMNALWQEFYSMDDMTPRDQIQREISETYLKLQKAQQDEAKVKKEYEEARKRASRKNRR